MKQLRIVSLYLYSAYFRCSFINLKTLRLSNSARKTTTVGEIVNLMAIDVESFQFITPYIQQFWSCPFQVCCDENNLFNLTSVIDIT